MLKHMSRAALALCLMTLPALAQNIGGTYRIEGTGLDGRPYRGEAEIIITTEVTCDIIWRTGSGESVGICMRRGDVFVAGYDSPQGIGLAIYDIQRNGRLVGTWTIAGVEAVGTETLIPR
jgi:hypothetical protein